MRLGVCVGLFLALGMTGSLAGQTVQTAGVGSERHPYSGADWSSLHSAAATAVAVDGTILYAVVFGGAKGPTHREWWTVGADGTGAAKLNLPEGFSPIGFAADGKGLYGAWKLNKRNQLAVFRVQDHKADGVPSLVVVLPRGMNSASPSPDGKRFAIVADPREPDVLDEVRHIQEPELASLYIVNSDGTGGQWWCRDLTNVSQTLTSGGGSNTTAWSADSKSLAVLSQLPKLTHHEVRTMVDVCDPRGSRRVAEIPNSVNGIAWTNGGTEIAFLSTETGTQTPEHLWTVSAAGGTAKDRTPSLNGRAAQLAGDARGRLWVMVDQGVQTAVEEFRGGALEPAYRWPPGVIAGLPARVEYAGAESGPAFTVADPEHSGNVAIEDGDGLRRITHESDDLLGKVALGPVKVVRWKSKEGISLEGIATFPWGYVEGRKYPFVVLPHGGPESSDKLVLDAFSRLLAGQGYVVLQPEYRGSTGYGTAFLAAIYQHFGDRAFRDVDSATDFAIAQGWADSNRLAIFGWSAGGFMTSWTVTQTNRYKAAVEGAGITDWEPFLWTSDVPQTDYDNRWTDEDPEAFRQFSVMAFAKNVTTPLLILHGEQDIRVPEFQGLEYFEILAARGKTVRMVTYPGSGHFPTLWEQRLNVFQEVIDWLGKYDK